VRLASIVAAFPAILPEVPGAPTGLTIGLVVETGAAAFQGPKARVVQEPIDGPIVRLITRRSTGGNDHGGCQDGEDRQFHGVNSGRSKSLSVNATIATGDWGST
jgi:hypothetical protein